MKIDKSMIQDLEYNEIGEAVILSLEYEAGKQLEELLHDKDRLIKYTVKKWAKEIDRQNDISNKRKKARLGK